VRKRKTQWAWMYDGAERCSEAFDTIAKAIADAVGSEATGLVSLGTCRWAGLGDFVAHVDSVSMEERANEAAYDNDFAWYDDNLFSLKTACGGKRAQEMIDRADAELRRAVMSWAEKWITVDEVFTMEERLSIRIEDDGTWVVVA